MDKNKKIGFAVIGYGGMGSWHASTCADDFKDTAELIGIYDIKPERRAAAEAEGIHAFSSRAELLADDSHGGGQECYLREARGAEPRGA